MIRRVAASVLRRAEKLRRRLFGGALEVVFHERYTAALPGVPYDALRAEHILAFLGSEGVVLPNSVRRPRPVAIKDLQRVHSAAYLDRLHDPAELTRSFGVDITLNQVDRLLDEQRIQTGGTVWALRLARRNGLAVNLGGGMHHAHADHGGGFCLFNDVAVAIAVERARGFAGRVSIVDFDLHDGDGTRDIFRHDLSVHTLSIHAVGWGDTEAKASTSVALGAGVDDHAYLEAIDAHLDIAVAEHHPSLVVYLAGCDPAFDDPMGDWKITPAAMLERDRRVVAAAANAGAPLLVVLSGGYGTEAWRYSARFLAQLDGKRREPPSTEVMTLARYRHIAELFSSNELSGGGSGDFGITAADLELPGWSGMQESRFLGFYTKHAIELVLERAGFLDRLRDQGYDSPTLKLQLDDPAGHTVRVFGDSDQKDLLTEMRLRRDRRTFAGLELLSVEWLLMQNPRGQWSGARPRLPGQEHPGLGMLADLVAMLILICDRLHLDGLVFVPSRFHIAAYGRRHMRFVRAETQARFDAMFNFFDAQGVSFAEATRAVGEGRLIDRDTGEPVRWRPEPMVLPVSDAMRELGEELDEIGDQEGRWRFRLIEAD